jgi:hypothetical protein
MEHYRLIKNGPNDAIYSLESNQKNLKLVMTLPHPRHKVMAAMIDPANHHFWNDEVDLGNIKLLIRNTRLSTRTTARETSCI